MAPLLKTALERMQPTVLRHLMHASKRGGLLQAVFDHEMYRVLDAATPRDTVVCVQAGQVRACARRLVGPALMYP